MQELGRRDEIWDGEKEGKSLRRSKDKIVNREGKILIDSISERDWVILNDSFENEGGQTLSTHYAIANTDAEEEIRLVKEGEREDRFVCL